MCDGRTLLNYKWGSKSQRHLGGMEGRETQKGTSKGEVPPLREDAWMKSEGHICNAYLMKASHHNQLLVEGMPAGWVFSWRKLSIRSEEPKHKEALCERRNSYPKGKAGGPPRDLLAFPALFAVFSMSFFRSHAWVLFDVINQSPFTAPAWGWKDCIGKMVPLFPAELFSLPFSWLVHFHELY